VVFAYLARPGEHLQEAVRPGEALAQQRGLGAGESGDATFYSIR